jgi:cytochrome c oxidase assembly factor CtaG
VEAPLEATALVPALAIAYALAWRRARPPRARVAAFAAAAALIVAAFVTPLERYALHTFLWAHLLQNVVLAEWAPALLVLAVPPSLARGRRPLHPLAALVVWLGTYFVWHLPWLYDLALRHPHSLLHVEHVTYVVAGFLLWWPVVHEPISAGAKAAYLFAAFVLASPLGLLLALLPKPVYAFYRDAPRSWGPRPLGDQQLAGVTMAAEQAVVFFSVFAAFLLRFLQEEQSAGLVRQS